MEKPFVSVIMPNYNNAEFIEEAIKSILQQSYGNFEFIIIDDSSSDKSWEIIKKFEKQDKRIKAFRHKKNKNIVATRNEGFSLASKDSKYYVIFDSDDISLPERIEKQVRYLEHHPYVGAVGSSTYIIDEKGKNIGFRSYDSFPSKIKKSIYIKSPFAQPSVMIRAEVIKKIGMYTSEKGYNRARDYDLWLRISKKYKLANIHEPLIKYRVSEKQGKKTHLKETLRSTIQVQKKHLSEDKIISLKEHINLMLEQILLLLPESIILFIFKKIRYDKKSDDFLENEIENLNLLNPVDLFRHMVKIRFIHFFVTGASGVLINLGLTAFFAELVFGRERYFSAYLIGLSANLLYNFTLHTIMTFKTKEEHLKRFFIFVSYSLIMSFIQAFLIKKITDFIGKDWYLVVVASTILIFSFFTFIVLKKWLFNESKNGSNKKI